MVLVVVDGSGGVVVRNQHIWHVGFGCGNAVEQADLNRVQSSSYEVTKNLTQVTNSPAQKSVHYACVPWVKSLPSLSVRTNVFGN